jgi:hypothetical protein
MFLCSMFAHWKPRCGLNRVDDVEYVMFSCWNMKTLHIPRHLLYANHTEVSSVETWNMKTLHIRRHLLYTNYTEVSIE